MTQPHDLHAWTENAINRVEQVATAAAEAVSGASWESDGSEVVATGPGGGTIADGVMYGDLHESIEPAACVHMALNDPEAVLRRCATDRKLLALHGPWTGEPASDESCKGCGFDNQEEPMVADYRDCPVLRALAEGYGWTEDTP